jgi:hypothetical protein
MYLLNFLSLIGLLAGCTGSFKSKNKETGKTSQIEYSQSYLPAISSLFDRTNYSSISSFDLDYDGKSDLIVRYTNKIIIYWGGSKIVDSTTINISSCTNYSPYKYGENQTHLYCGVSNTHYIIKNNGDRTFSTETNTGFNVTYPTMKDLDNDGLADLYNYNTSTDTLRFAKNLGDGNFSPEVSVSMIGVGVDQMQTPIDVNNDGLLDFVFARAGSVEIVFLASNFSNYTTSQETYSSNFGASTHSNSHFGLGDFNSDGRMDFVALSQVDGTLNIHLQQSTGSFVVTNIDTFNSSGNSTSNGVFVLDVNNDGIDDIFHTDDNMQDPTKAVFTTILGKTSGTLSENAEVVKLVSEVSGMPTSSYSISEEKGKKILGVFGFSAAGFYFTFDVNGDLADILHFAEVISNQTVTGGSVHSSKAFDKNGDGYIEGFRAYTNGASNAFQTFASLSQGDGTWTQHQVTSNSCTAHVYIAGVSTTGFYSFFCPNTTNDRYEFYKMTSFDGSTYVRFDVTNQASSDWGVVLNDMDEDMKRDLLMHNETSGEWQLYWAQSDLGAVGTDSTVINLESSSSPVIGRAQLDFNGDGLQDFIAAHNSGEIFLYIHKPKSI